MAMPIHSIVSRSLTPRWQQRAAGSVGSAQTSPSNRSNTSSSTGSLLTISSLKGKCLYLVVQMTRDLHPVIYSTWLLPESRFDLCVNDVTLEQFEALSTTHGRSLESIIDTSAFDWHNRVSQSMVSLELLMKASHIEINSCKIKSFIVACAFECRSNFRVSYAPGVPPQSFQSTPG
jgi:CDK inhibitor PHO81